MDNLYRVQAASPELAALMRRLKTIYAITGGEVPKSAGGKMGFNEKKSVLIAQLSNFDKVRLLRGCDASSPRLHELRSPPTPLSSSLSPPPVARLSRPLWPFFGLARLHSPEAYD